ncbi:major facilitator superfamily domain-containing protein [Rhexocercosporidium sp. MPI-PUGE-AT-0058]|nr:major facilitator superfamily domain-containing protein [Rhexocercosporidium sp. MPI-PUGE-AT-0058]
MTLQADNEKASGSSFSINNHLDIQLHDIERPSISSHPRFTKDDVKHGITNPSSEVVKNVNSIDWDGPLDRQNPLNWSTSKKATNITLLSLITFLSPFTSTMISPGTQSLMTSFNSTSTTLASFITSSYLLGYAFGPLVLAPLSEIHGRLPIYHVCNILFLIFNIACAVAPNLGALIGFRLLAGIAGSCPVTIGAGSIADMIVREKRGGAMAAWMLGPLFGPSIGPLVGGYLTEATSWRWSFWVPAIAGGILTILTLFFMSESYPPAIIAKKTAQLIQTTSNSSLVSALQSPLAPSALLKQSILRPLKMLTMSPIIFLLSMYTAIVYSYLYLCFTTFPTIFEEQYGFSQGSSGLAYLGIGVGSFIGIGIGGFLSDRILKHLTARHAGKPKPEYRLPTMVVGGFVVPVGLFMYGWTAEVKAHWILPIIGTGLLGTGTVIAYLASSTYLIDAYTTHAASVTAASTVFRSLLGALLPLAGRSMYAALGVGWGTSVLAFISLALIPLPFVFYVCGQRIRESKRFSVEF